MKIRLVGAELFHADGRTDMTKLIVAFRNFAKAPKHVKFNEKQADAFHILNKDCRRLYWANMQVRTAENKLCIVGWGASSAKWERPLPAGNSIS